MIVTKLRRPWENTSRTQGTRYNPDPRYRSPRWRRLRTIHIAGHTEVNGTQVSNKFCIPCYRETGNFVPMHTVDHKQAVKMGGDFWDTDNLESQCKTHHARKSANEGKQQPGK